MSVSKIKKPQDVDHFLILNKSQNLSQNFDFCTCPSHNVVKCDATGKKGKLLCSKRIFDRIKANLAKIQGQNLHFLQKAPGVNGLNTFTARFNAISARLKTSAKFFLLKYSDY